MTVQDRESLDPAAIMAAHRPDDDGDCVSCCWTVAAETSADPWPCETYRLAEALIRAWWLIDGLQTSQTRMEQDNAYRLEERRELRAENVALREQVQQMFGVISQEVMTTSRPMPNFWATHFADALDRARAALAGEDAADQKTTQDRVGECR